ncbi:exported protein A EppA [Borreliella afzelii]|uniref:exported protein A EppA n=1 Tax=Borreliella afzelii TaxID=29518 RepID=UPI003AF8F3D7
MIIAFYIVVKKNHHSLSKKGNSSILKPLNCASIQLSKLIIDKRLDKYDFKSEVNKSILFAFAPQIRGCLRKIGIKEKDVFLDALDVIGYLFKYECIFYIDTISNYDLNYIIELINGKPYGIFNRMNKKVNSDKYGDKAKENFEESYSENKVNTVKQTLKQISTDLLASSSKCK